MWENNTEKEKDYSKWIVSKICKICKNILQIYDIVYKNILQINEQKTQNLMGKWPNNTSKSCTELKNRMKKIEKIAH